MNSRERAGDPPSRAHDFNDRPEAEEETLNLLSRTGSAIVTLPACAVMDRLRAAHYIGVSMSKLAQLTTSHQIPSLLIGRRRLYRSGDLDAWLADRVSINARG